MTIKQSKKYITVHRQGTVTNYSILYYTLIGNSVITRDEHCKVVATLN